MSEPQQPTTLSAPITVPASMETLKYKEELAAKMGLPSPYGMSLLKEACQDIVASGFAPSCFKANPSAVFLAAMRGREMGLDPFESILETFWASPQGRLGMYSNKMLYIMHQRGVTSEFIKEDAEGCEILFTPPPPHGPYTARFAATEAKDAGLIKPDSNWVKWRTDMNRARAISRGWRALAGTFGKGTANMYSQEEIQDFEPASNEPTAEDQRRVEVLAAKDDFRVALKPQVVPIKPEEEDVHPITTSLREHAKLAQEDTARRMASSLHSSGASTTAPVASAESHKPTVAPISVMKSASVGPTVSTELPFVINVLTPSGLQPVNEPPQSTLGMAMLRARALSNESHMTYTVTRGGETVGVVPLPVDEPKADAPLPPKPEPPKAEAPKAADPLREQVKARLAALVKIIDPSPKAVSKTWLTRFNSFVAGYLGVGLKNLPSYVGEWLEPVAELEACIARDVDEFRAGPERAGQSAKKRTLELRSYCESKWGDARTRELAYALARQWGLDAPQFGKWVEYHDLDFIQLVDLHAFLRLALRTRSADKLLKHARNTKSITVAEGVAGIEYTCGPLEQAGTKAVESALTQVLESRTAAPQAAPPPALRPNPPAPTDGLEDDGDTGLFSDI